MNAWEGPHQATEDGFVSGPAGKSHFVTHEKIVLFNSIHRHGIAEGLRMAAEMTETLCGVNPHTHRPCISHVDKKFWCPVCAVAGEIRSMAKEVEEGKGEK